MSNVKNGNIKFIGQFTPETEPKFWFLSPDGQSVAVGVSGIADVVFLTPCGESKELEGTSGDCVVVNIADAKV